MAQIKQAVAEAGLTEAEAVEAGDVSSGNPTRIQVAKVIIYRRRASSRSAVKEHHPKKWLGYLAALGQRLLKRQALCVFASGCTSGSAVCKLRENRALDPGYD